MTKPNTALLVCLLHIPQPFLQLPILALKLLYPQLQPIHLLLGSNTKFLNDLEKAPETEDDDERSDFFEDAMQEHVHDEAG